MDGAWLVRVRWRRRGAWLWPAFSAAVVTEALIGHALPSSGETESVLGAGLSACVLNLLAVVILSRPLGAGLRALRGDLPKVVARDYAGIWVLAFVAAALVAAGIVHRPSVLAHRRATQDAVARAQAWIGARAPGEFRRNLQSVSVIPIQPGSVYRACVLSGEQRRTYCVIVRTNLPLQGSVSFAGYEPNSMFGGSGR